MKKVLLKLIRKYQKYLSPDTGHELKHCKYYPTCSEYAYQSIEKYGVIVGVFKGMIRVIKCNPFSKGGVDKVK